jgi:hypothetical protein
LLRPHRRKHVLLQLARGLALTQVCKQIHAEAKPIAWSHIAASFDAVSSGFESYANRQIRNKILNPNLGYSTHLDLQDYTLFDIVQRDQNATVSANLVPPILEIMGKLTGIKSVRIGLESEPNDSLRSGSRPLPFASAERFHGCLAKFPKLRVINANTRIHLDFDDRVFDRKQTQRMW